MATVCVSVSVCGTMVDIDGKDVDTNVESEVNDGYIPICGEMGCSFVSGSVTRFGRVKKARNAI